MSPDFHRRYTREKRIYISQIVTWLKRASFFFSTRWAAYPIGGYVTERFFLAPWKKERGFWVSSKSEEILERDPRVGFYANSCTTCTTGHIFIWFLLHCALWFTDYSNYFVGRCVQHDTRTHSRTHNLIFSVIPLRIDQHLTPDRPRSLMTKLFDYFTSIITVCRYKELSCIL